MTSTNRLIKQVKSEYYPELKYFFVLSKGVPDVNEENLEFKMYQISGTKPSLLVRFLTSSIW